MSDNVLYFPYISVPKSPWLIRTLLYWDKVGSIVPYEYVNNPENYSPFMRELLIEGLVEQVFPSNYIWEIPRFKESFLDYLNVNPTIRYRLFRQHKPFRIHREKMGLDNQNFGIHLEKLDDLGEELVGRGYAERVSPSWYDVNPYVGYKFMTYLASCLGVVTEYKPMTDGYRGLSNLITYNFNRHQESALRSNLRTKILKEILPTPVDVENVYQLLKFKEKHGQKLSRFRNYIEQFLLEVEAAPPEQGEERISRFIKQSQDEISDISSTMKKQWIVSLSSFCAVSGAVLSLAEAACSQNGLAYSSATFGVISAVSQALSSKQLTIAQNNHLAYAVSARSFSPANVRTARKF